MKLFLAKFTAITIIAAFTGALFQGGCAGTSTSQIVTPQNTQIGIALLSTGILNRVNQSDHQNAVNVAKDMFAAAVAIRTLESGNHVPSSDELSAAVLTFLPKAGEYVQLVQLIATGYQAALPQIGNNIAKAQPWMEALAAGLESGARPFIGPVPYGTPEHQPTPPHVPPFPDFSPAPVKSPAGQ